MPDLTLGRLIHTSKSLVQWNLNAEVSLVHSAKDPLTSTVAEDFFPSRYVQHGSLERRGFQAGVKM